MFVSMCGCLQVYVESCVGVCGCVCLCVASIKRVIEEGEMVQVKQLMKRKEYPKKYSNSQNEIKLESFWSS